MYSGHAATGRPTARGIGLFVGAASAVLVLIIGAFSVASAQGYAVVHRCVDLGSTGAVWGVRLALVRDSAACPAGEVAMGGAPDAAVHVVGALAVSVLVAHAMALFFGIGAGAAIARAVTRCRETLCQRLVAGVSMGVRVVGTTKVKFTALGRRSAAVARAVHGASVTWRGPPVSFAV